ncbi:hypothetical protein RUM44_004148 [Polyplax serrata]|uniref:Uncharacterized protein n=1 Tax=Polyplax serrata TaxID=468196 RepID=A0ABR1B2P4_POLSC
MEKEVLQTERQETLLCQECKGKLLITPNEEHSESSCRIGIRMLESVKFQKCKEQNTCEIGG